MDLLEFTNLFDSKEFEMIFGLTAIGLVICCLLKISNLLVTNKKLEWLIQIILSVVFLILMTVTILVIGDRTLLIILLPVTVLPFALGISFEVVDTILKGQLSKWLFRDSKNP